MRALGAEIVLIHHHLSNTKTYWKTDNNFDYNVMRSVLDIRI